MGITQCRRDSSACVREAGRQRREAAGEEVKTEAYVLRGPK